MSHHELNTTLEDIARAAHEELKSDIVLLYEHNPLTKQVGLGGYFGEIYDRERFDAMVGSMCPVVDLEVTMNDNGIGFLKEAVTERGIANMRERVRKLGGKFNIESTVGEGTQISITLPL